MYGKVVVYKEKEVIYGQTKNTSFMKKEQKQTQEDMGKKYESQIRFFLFLF